MIFFSEGMKKTLENGEGIRYKIMDCSFPSMERKNPGDFFFLLRDEKKRKRGRNSVHLDNRKQKKNVVNIFLRQIASLTKIVDMISSLTDSRNLYTIVLYLRVLSMRRKCTSLHYFLEPALWEAIRLYSLILSGKINHESLFSLYILVFFVVLVRSSFSLLCLSILCWQ